MMPNPFNIATLPALYLANASCDLTGAKLGRPINLHYTTKLFIEFENCAHMQITIRPLFLENVKQILVNVISLITRE